MRRRPEIWLIIAATCLSAWPVAALAQTSSPPPKPAATASAKPPAPDLSARLSAQMNAIDEKLSALLTDELRVTADEMKAVSAATANIEDVKAAADNLFRGKPAKGLPEYRQALLAAAGQWLLLYQKLQPIAVQAKTLQRDRAKATPEVQTLIDQLVGRIDEKGRNMQEKVSELYETAGEYRRAVACYTAVLQGIPEAKRAGEKKLFGKIVTLHTLLGDIRNAMLFYRTLQAVLPEEERYKDVGLGVGICDMLDMTSDFRTEMQLLQVLHAANPDNKNLSDRYTELLRRTGGAPVSGAAKTF